MILPSTFEPGVANLIPTEHWNRALYIPTRCQSGKKNKKKHVSASIKDGDSMEPSSREKIPWKGKIKDGAGWGLGMGVGRLERRGSAPDSGPWDLKVE